MSDSKEKSIVYYEIKVNDKGEKVCIIDGKEIKIVHESATKIELEDGKVMETYFLKGEKMGILPEKKQGELDIMAHSNETGPSKVKISNTVPTTGETGDIAVIYGKGEFYQVVAIPGIEQGIRGGEITINGEGDNSRVSVGKLGEDHTVLTGTVEIEGNGEFEGEVYRGGKIKTEVYEPVPEPKETEVIDKSKIIQQENKKSKILKIARRVGGVLLIPIIFFASCDRCFGGKDGCVVNFPDNCVGDSDKVNEPSGDPSNPKPFPDEPSGDISNPEPIPDEPSNPEPIPPVPNIIIDTDETVQEIISMGQNFRAMLTNNNRDNFANSDYIAYDVNNFMNGKTIEDALGKEFLGTSTSDGMPSSFYSKLEEKYMIKDGILELVNDINTSQAVFLMTESELQEEVKNINLERKNNNQQLIQINAKNEEEYKRMATTEIIKDKLGFDLETVEGCEELLKVYEIYAKLQLEASKENEELLKMHKDTTKESQKVRSGEAKESYEREETGLSESERERKNLTRQDEHQLEMVNDLLQNVQNLSLIQNKSINMQVFSPQQVINIGYNQNTQFDYER